MSTSNSCNDLVGLQNPPFNWTLREFKTFNLFDLFPTLGVTATTATALASDNVTTLNASLAPDGSIVINGQTYPSLSIVRDSTKQTVGDSLFVDGKIGDRPLFRDFWNGGARGSTPDPSPPRAAPRRFGGRGAQRPRG